MDAGWQWGIVSLQMPVYTVWAMITHCECRPLICGSHIIFPCHVRALKQVPSQQDRDKSLFLVIIEGTTDTSVFLNDAGIAPLLEYWGLDAESIEPVVSMSPEARAEYYKRLRGIRRAVKNKAKRLKESE